MFNRTFRLKKKFKGDPLWGGGGGGGGVGVERDGFINKTYSSFSDLFFSQWAFIQLLPHISMQLSNLIK